MSQDNQEPDHCLRLNDSLSEILRSLGEDARSQEDDEAAFTQGGDYFYLPLEDMTWTEGVKACYRRKSLLLEVLEDNYKWINGREANKTYYVESIFYKKAKLYTYASLKMIPEMLVHARETSLPEDKLEDGQCLVYQTANSTFTQVQCTEKHGILCMLHSSGPWAAKQFGVAEAFKRLAAQMLAECEDGQAPHVLLDEGLLNVTITDACLASGLFLVTVAMTIMCLRKSRMCRCCCRAVPVQPTSRQYRAVRGIRRKPRVSFPLEPIGHDENEQDLDLSRASSPGPEAYIY